MENCEETVVGGAELGGFSVFMWNLDDIVISINIIFIKKNVTTIPRKSIKTIKIH